MKNLFFICTLFIYSTTFSQKDSLKLGHKYLEDQLYISISYNVLRDQPIGINSSGFSYGFSTGFIKDFPFNKQGNFGAGLGIGYGFDSFNHRLKITNTNGQSFFEIGNALTSNKLRLHSIEIPIEFRWRTSTAKKYNFWRVYAGVKVTYNFSNRFEYVDTDTFIFSNVSSYNKWQTGLTLSAGYAVFNFNVYYGLTPIFKDALLDTATVSSKIIKFGLIFYIL